MPLQHQGEEAVALLLRGWSHLPLVPLQLLLTQLAPVLSSAANPATMDLRPYTVPARSLTLRHTLEQERTRLWLLARAIPAWRSVIRDTLWSVLTLGAMDPITGHFSPLTTAHDASGKLIIHRGHFFGSEEYCSPLPLIPQRDHSLVVQRDAVRWLAFLSDADCDYADEFLGRFPRCQIVTFHYDRGFPAAHLRDALRGRAMLKVFAVRSTVSDWDPADASDSELEDLDDPLFDMSRLVELHLYYTERFHTTEYLSSINDAIGDSHPLSLRLSSDPSCPFSNELFVNLIGLRFLHELAVDGGVATLLPGLDPAGLISGPLTSHLRKLRMSVERFGQVFANPDLTIYAPELRSLTLLGSRDMELHDFRAEHFPALTQLVIQGGAYISASAFRSLGQLSSLVELDLHARLLDSNTSTSNGLLNGATTPPVVPGQGLFPRLTRAALYDIQAYQWLTDLQLPLLTELSVNFVTSLPGPPSLAVRTLHLAGRESRWLTVQGLVDWQYRPQLRKMVLHGPISATSVLKLPSLERLELSLSPDVADRHPQAVSVMLRQFDSVYCTGLRQIQIRSGNLERLTLPATHLKVFTAYGIDAAVLEALSSLAPALEVVSWKRLSVPPTESPGAKPVATMHLDWHVSTADARSDTATALPRGCRAVWHRIANTPQAGLVTALDRVVIHISSPDPQQHILRALATLADQATHLVPPSTRNGGSNGTVEGPAALSPLQVVLEPFDGRNADHQQSVALIMADLVEAAANGGQGWTVVVA
ncbi:hypothetical protein BC828DRAFT_378115 [Blastocladiella britannica]|nr:hypothetical protein BC828DRAFT_378115 [Blastocladiella britannica]